MTQHTRHLWPADVGPRRCTCGSARLRVIHIDGIEAMVNCLNCGIDGPAVYDHDSQARIEAALEAYDRWLIERAAKGVA